MRQFRRAGGRGLNVTVPHKSEVAMLADTLSDRARTAGAVNTLVFEESGVFGDNTDGIGLMRDLQHNLGLQLEGINILILGAGGATRGIVQPLLAAKPKSLTIANRTLSRASALADHFGAYGDTTACRFDEVPESTDFGLIINATSAGLKGESPPYPESAVKENTYCYDLSYGLNPTPFSKWAAQHGAAHSVMGWGMLVEQAAESFQLWRGMRPDTEPVLKQLSISAL